MKNKNMVCYNILIALIILVSPIFVYLVYLSNANISLNVLIFIVVLIIITILAIIRHIKKM